MLSLPISFRVASLALGQSYDCPSASEVTLKDMKTDWQQTTPKHNKARILCIFLGKYCISNVSEVKIWQFCTGLSTYRLSINHFWPDTAPKCLAFQITSGRILCGGHSIIQKTNQISCTELQWNRCEETSKKYKDTKLIKLYATVTYELRFQKKNVHIPLSDSQGQEKLPIGQEDLGKVFF